VRLAGADHGPLDIAHRLPPAQALGVGPSAARGLVGVEERLHLAQPRDRPLGVAEPPRADREPADVLGRVAQMAELPVDYRRQSVPVDDEVAKPEVAVYEPDRGRRRRRVEAQPAQARLDRRQRLADLGQLVLPQLARLERRSALPAGEPVDGGRIDGMDLGERRGQLPRQALAGHGELLAAKHARRHRRAGNELHQVAGAGAEAPTRRLGGNGAGDRDARQIRRRDRTQLELERRERHALARLAPEHEARLSPCRDHERLPRGAALDRCQLDLARVLADLGEHPAHRRGLGWLSRHPRSV
jgi:hypothetical protein